LSLKEGCHIHTGLRPTRWTRIVRYDNERGKGDHRHIDDSEESYTFSTLRKLVEDFETDIERMFEEA